MSSRLLTIILPTFFAILLMPAVSASGIDSISVSDTSASPGDNATISLHAVNMDNIGSLQLELLYDPGVINAVSVAQGSAVSGAMFVPNIDNLAGKVTIGIISITGLSGSGYIANINFSVIGSGGSTSQLNITVVSLTDPANAPIDTWSDVANGTFYVTDPTLSTFNITLLQGWNLISIPLEQDNWSITSVMSSIEGNYTVVYTYVNGVWKKSTAARNPLTVMSRNYAYWVDMSAPDTLELSGAVPSVTTLNLVTGWNFAGYPSLTTQNISTVLAPVNYSVVYAYVNGVWKKSTAARNPLTELMPGYGNWIYANEDGSYEV